MNALPSGEASLVARVIVAKGFDSLTPDYEQFIKRQR